MSCNDSDAINEDDNTSEITLIQKSSVDAAKEIKQQKVDIALLVPA